MTSPNPDQAAEIEFISGVTAFGTVSSHSFQSWNRDAPATYGPTSDEAKWGSPVAGTAGTLTVAFDPASHWSGTEQQAFLAAMHLWSAVANIHINVTSSTSAAGLVISRTSDREAQETDDQFYRGTENSTHLGTLLKTSIGIDTSVAGFGPVGAGLGTPGGYPWMTIEHEIGHAIGLGHAGPYNADPGDSGTYPTLGGYDSKAWSIMSYQGSDSHSPTTPMILDIAAAQRLYGLPTDSPLSGGQVFGFHSNISGDLSNFYNFSSNTNPFVTIWDGGDNNTLDLSGFAPSANVSLVDGSLNSVGGGTSNLGIAFGTRIETVIGGAGSDTFQGNALGDVIMGGGGADTLTGGSGNDHIYGNMATAQQGASDGIDVIVTGGGNDYVNGNAGDDHITASTGDNRIYGGSGNDTISIGSGNNHVNGNTGDDTILIDGPGNNVVFGGQGADVIRLGDGNTVVSGDAGNDHISFGSGYVLATGGADQDIFDISHAPINRGGALTGYVDEITDFQVGTDKLYLLAHSSGAVDVLHAASGVSYASASDAETAAQALLQGDGYTGFAAMQVGNDTYLLWSSYSPAATIDAGVKLDGVGAASLTADSFSNHS